MKKNIYKILATTLALTIMAASPMATINSYALGFNGDSEGHDDSGNNLSADRWDWMDSSPSNSGSSSDSSSSYSEPSYSEPSYSEPSHSGGSSDSGSSDSGSSDSGSSTVSAPKKNPNDMVVRVTDGQLFRIIMSTDHISYQVLHCGISRVSFEAVDADGNAVKYSTVKLEKGEDGLWYINTKFAEGVDTEGFNVAVTDGDASYLANTLGVSGIKINGTVVLSTVPATDAK